MKVEAVRDDGALLISDGGMAAAIVSDDGVWLTTVDAALARGQWSGGAGMAVPRQYQAMLSGRLPEYAAQLPADPLAELEPVTAAADMHLQGQHDQARHGNRPNRQPADSGELADTPPAVEPTVPNPQPDGAGDTAPVEHTGAMIALIPSDADLARLVVDGGEPPEELHCTLLYLGEAADIPPDAQQAIIDQLTAVLGGWPVVDADGFALALFNPDGVENANDREPCAVLQLSGEDLDNVHGIVEETLLDVVDQYDTTDPADPTTVTWEPPEQHCPWIAHVTLQYQPDPSALAGLLNRVGPVVFDKVRVAFAGQNTDIPLAPESALPGDQPMPPDGPAPPPAAAAAPPGTGDFVGRMPPALERYWLRKLAPFGPGTFRRCVRGIRKYFPKSPEGTCANLIKTGSGHWPGEHHSANGTALASEESTMTAPKTAPTPPPASPDVPPQCPAGAVWDPDVNDGAGGCVDADGNPVAVVALPTAADTATGGASYAATPVALPTGSPAASGTAAAAAAPAPAAAAPPPPVPDQGDCPDGQHPDPDSGDCVPNEPAATDQGDAKPEHFHAVMHVEGVSTGMRMFKEGSLTWRTPPFAFHWQRNSSAHSGTPETVQVGNVTRAQRDGATIHGWGRLDLGCPDGVEYARKLVEGWSAWVSIGLDESPADAEYIWPDGTENGDDVATLFAEPEQIVFSSGRIGELTAVSVPAQAEATIEPTQVLLDALDAIGQLPEGATLAAAGHSRRDGAPLVAAGHIIELPDRPPAHWFDRPIDVTPRGALTVTDEGRIYGYLAPAGVAHRAYRDRRVTVPTARVDYSRWMGRETIVAGGGRLVTGVITMGCGHCPPHASADPARRMEHYDNSCSVAATARIGEDQHGVWIAGALHSGVSADQVERMMACVLSGDWAPHPERPGWQEFVAALLVPVPGFPMSRSGPSVRVEQDTLVAAAVPVRFAEHTTDHSLRPALERIAASIGRDSRSRMRLLRSKVHAGKEVT